MSRFAFIALIVLVGCAADKQAAHAPKAHSDRLVVDDRVVALAVYTNEKPSSILVCRKAKDPLKYPCRRVEVQFDETGEPKGIYIWTRTNSLGGKGKMYIIGKDNSLIFEGNVNIRGN